MPERQTTAHRWTLALGVSLILAAWLSFSGCDPNRSGGPSSRPSGKSIGGTGEEKSQALSAKSDAEHLFLGTFEVASGQILVSDPCYPYKPDEKQSLSTLITSAKNGTWRASVSRQHIQDAGVRCLRLTATHQDAHEIEEGRWKAGRGTIGVDSGQAGIFDARHYDDSSVVAKDYQWKDGPIEPNNRWYSLCCDKTLSGPGAGVIPYGVVSSTGFGDGGYEFSTVTDAGSETVGIRIVFITEDDLGP